MMVSAFENAVVKGEGLRQVLQGMLQDMAKIILRKNISDPLASYFGSLFGGDSGPEQLAGPRAAGGPVSAGSTYLVGEQGPELFVPSGSGTIIPNGAMGGGGSVVQNITINQAGATVQDMMAVLLPAMRGVARNEIGNQLRPGGVLA